MGSAGAGQQFFSNDSHANDLEYLHWDYQAVYVPDTQRRAAMQAANAFDFEERCNPNQHPDGYVPVGPDWVLLVLLSQRQVTVSGTTGRLWRIVKCAKEEVSARTCSMLLGRTTRRRPNGMGFTVLVPEAVLDGFWWEDDGDAAVEVAREWAAEMSQSWSLEAEGWAPSAEIPVDPDQALYLKGQRQVAESDPTAEEAIRIVDAEYQRARQEAETAEWADALMREIGC